MDCEILVEFMLNVALCIALWSKKVVFLGGWEIDSTGDRIWNQKLDRTCEIASESIWQAVQRTVCGFVLIK